jgi:hypothetical protein
MTLNTEMTLRKQKKRGEKARQTTVIFLFCSLAHLARAFRKLGQPNIPVSLTIGRTLLQWPTSE